MGRLHRCLIRLSSVAFAALLLSFVGTQPATAAAREKAELAWNVDSTTYLHYAVEAQVGAGEETDPKPNLQYVHLMGYEIGPDGRLVALSRPWLLEELLFQLGAAVPGAAAREEDSWTREWNFDRVSGTQQLEVSSSYLFKELASYGGHTCAHIVGTHKLKAERADDNPPRWTKFELTSDAYFNAEVGCLLGLKLALRASKLEPAPEADKDPVTKNYLWDIEWKLTPPVDTTDTDWIKKKVDIAITRGVERLWAQRNKEGHWPYSKHQRGGTALALLALLMCGENPDDPRIVEAFTLLKDTEFVTTYDVAVSIMAYEARYISKAEREAFLKGEKAQSGPRALAKEDLAEVQRLTDWLIANRNEPNVMWNYTRDAENAARYDFSVTQYALLGLGTAMRCGAKIPTGYVRELVQFVRTLQTPDGPEIKRVVDYKPGKKKRGKKGDDKVTLSTKGVKARGWAYANAATWTRETGDTSAYGSMTSAGITTLIAGLDIAANMDDAARRAEFTNNSMYKNWERDTQLALDSGMAWMELWFSVTRNPNHGRYWYYYYLYGLERICMLSDVRYLGVHDWYFQGAAALISLQGGDGGWGGAVDTSFALLFLKRGTVVLNKPVYTGGPKE